MIGRLGQGTVLDTGVRPTTMITLERVRQRTAGLIPAEISPDMAGHTAPGRTGWDHGPDHKILGRSSSSIEAR
jgi:hypothetical protein